QLLRPPLSRPAQGRAAGGVSETRKLAAILVADVVGYSRLAGADEERTLARLRGLRGDFIDPAVAAHHGRIVKRRKSERSRFGEGGLARAGPFRFGRSLRPAGSGSQPARS